MASIAAIPEIEGMMLSVLKMAKIALTNQATNPLGEIERLPDSDSML